MIKSKGVAKMKKLSDFESNDDSDYYYQGYPGVTITDINMEFSSMVLFMVKWVIASIPAFIILATIVFLFLLGFSLLLGGFAFLM